jgi:Domain of unknown function (DUF6487)
MQPEDDELNESIREMADEQLIKMVRDDAVHYRKEAMELARAEIAERGLVVFPTTPVIQCGKCGNRMEVGFIPDFGHYELVRPVTWVEGKPEHSFWKGTRIADKRQLNVEAYRCTSCGLIDFYASEDASK